MLFSKYRVDIYTRQTIKKWKNVVCLQAIINALFKMTVTTVVKYNVAIKVYTP